MRLPTLSIVTLLSTLLGTPHVATAQGQRIQSPDHQVALIELYTSEGCSSCPPADTWMSALQHDKRLWDRMVPVAFHVDYWDYIGWPDRFASPTYSTRHRDYHRLAGLRSVYTPGFLVKGEEWRGWFRYPTLQLGPPPKAGVITLDIAADGTRIEASYDAPSSAPSPPALDLHVAVLGFDLQTEVEAGENNGRILRHDFVVLGYQQTTLHGTHPRFTASTIMPESKFTASRRALAAWVSHKGKPAPLQAVGAWLAN